MKRIDARAYTTAGSSKGNCCGRYDRLLAIRLGPDQVRWFQTCARQIKIRRILSSAPANPQDFDLAGAGFKTRGPDQSLSDRDGDKEEMECVTRVAPEPCYSKGSRCSHWQTAATKDRNEKETITKRSFRLTCPGKD